MDKSRAQRGGGRRRHPRRRAPRRRRVRPLRHPERPDRRAARRRARPTSTSVATTAASTTGASACCSRQRRIRRMTSSLRRGEQGVRAAVPLRRARGRADPAGHAGRAAAGRRLPASPRSSRRPASAPRSPTAACRGATTAPAAIALASPAKETREFDGRTYVLEAAITTDFALVHATRGRPARQPASSTASTRNFNPLARWPAGSRSPRSRSSSSPASSTRRCTCPGSSSSAWSPSGRRTSRKRIERRTVAASAAATRATAGCGTRAERTVEASRWPSPGAAGRPRRAGARGRPVRQPRHRPADPGAQLPARRASRRPAERERHPRRRPVPDRGRGRPRPDQRRQGDRHDRCPAPASSTPRCRSA